MKSIGHQVMDYSPLHSHACDAASREDGSRNEQSKSSRNRLRWITRIVLRQMVYHRAQRTTVVGRRATRMYETHNSRALLNGPLAACTHKQGLRHLHVKRISVSERCFVALARGSQLCGTAHQDGVPVVDSNRRRVGRNRVHVYEYWSAI